jgi:hypothetical protein
MYMVRRLKLRRTLSWFAMTLLWDRIVKITGIGQAVLCKMACACCEFIIGLNNQGVEERGLLIT